jgi:hypothetical protein
MTKLRTSLLISSLIGGALVFLTGKLLAQDQAADTRASVNDKRDGQHDFDWAVGSWKIHLRKLVRPLTGSNEWVELDGTVVCRKIWDGRAEVEEFNVDSRDKKRHITGLALRLYNPQSHQWSIYWAQPEKGIVELPPMIGQFQSRGGRGEFYNQDFLDGRQIYTRFVWGNVTGSSPHFEQSYSADGGKTWETNWITDQTKEKP